MKNMWRLHAVGSIGVVVVLEFLFGMVWKHLKNLGEFASAAVNYDMLYFIFAIVSTVILTMVVSNVIKKVKIVQEISLGENSTRELFFEILTYFIIAYTHIRVFFNTMSVADAGSFYMPWHSDRVAEMLVVFLAIICVFECRLFIKQGMHCNQKTSLIPWYMFLVSASLYSLYQPNCFNAWYNLYHSHAYFNSVYRVLHAQPYNQINTGVYGFYGIILAPITKLLGADFRACVIALLILTLFSLLCYFYVLENLTDSVLLKILGSICIITPLISLSSNIYLQLWPHRIIFIGYMLAFIVRKHKNNNIFMFYNLIGYVIMILSIVWNFETGLGCVLAYFGSEIVYDLQRYSINDFKGWKRLFLNLIQIPIIVISAWILVGCYNLAVSGTFVSVKTFLFPFIGNEYVGNLNIPLSTFPSAWMLVLALIIVSVGAILLSTNLCGNQCKNQGLVYMTACTIGVAIQMLYFINRSVYGNLYIVLPVSTLIMIFWINYFIQQKVWLTSELFNGCFKALCTVLISIILLVDLMAVCRYFPLEMARTSGRNMDELENVKTMIAEQIPKDTMGIGVGIPELYSYLGWDTGFYGIDMADFGVLSDEEKSAVFEMVNNSDDILVNSTNLNEFRSYGAIEEFFETHNLVTNIVYGDISLEYYCRTGM